MLFFDWIVLMPETVSRTQPERKRFNEPRFFFNESAQDSGIIA
jgi:hypothetical protein